MSENVIPTFQVQQYSSNVALLLQQMGTRLSSTVMTGSHVGKQASPVDQVGAVTAQKVTTRFAPMGRVDAATDRRWVYPTDYDLPQLIDSFDKLRLITDPESVYVTNAVYAMGRARDEEILDAMFAAANTGESGGTSTSFLAGNVVSLDEGGTNSNLNVPKLRAAKRLLMSHDVDLDNDPLYCVVDSVNHDALLNEIQIVSSDYNGADMPVLKEGKVTRFLGINFIHTELSIAASRLGTDDQTTSTTSKQLPVYTKSGLHMGIWGDISSSVTTRNDLQGEPWQAYVKQTVGATRVEEKRVVKIWCAA
jgi:hypothetical protein